jgi:toxin ParE1/3/4
LSAFRVVFSRRARAQLARIRDYLTLHADDETGKRLTSALIDRCLELDDFPDRGTPHPELGAGVRTIVFQRKATIGYVVADTDVVVLGIAWRGQRLEAAIRHSGQRS